MIAQGSIYAVTALQAGHTEEAISALAEIGPNSDVAHMSEPLKRALASRAPKKWLAMSRLVDDLTSTVQVVRKPEAIATLIVFTGIQGRFCYLSLRHADALLAEYPVNVVYLRDPANRAYLSGVPSLGQDQSATAAALKQLQVDLGGVPLITLGASLGGFAALRYGALARARAAISFAGPTVLTALAEDGSDLSPRYLKQGNYFNTPALQAFSSRERDILPDVAENPDMHVWQVVGLDQGVDARQAERLERLPNVMIRHVSGVSDHFVALHMIGDGTFGPLLTSAISAASSQGYTAAQ